MSEPEQEEAHVMTRRGERRVFIFICVFLFPALSVITVGSYGLFIWVMQMIFGPPTSG